MSYFSKPVAVATVWAVLLSTPVFSQSLAESVVEGYFSQATQNGVAVSTGSKTISGNSVEWKDIVFAFPEDKGWLKMPFLRAEEIGDGKVSITYPDESSIFIKTSSDFPGLDASIGFEGVSHIISGPADARNQEFSADVISIHSAENDEAPLLIDIEVAGVRSSQVNGGSDVSHYKGDFAADKMLIAYDVQTDGMDMSFDSSTENVAVNIDMDVVSQKNVQDLFSGKRNFSLNYSFGAGRSEVVSNSPDFAGTITNSTGGGSGLLSLQGGSLAIEGQTQEVQYELKFSELPFPPFRANLESVNFQMGMPLKQEDGLLPANILMNVTGLKASDTIWGMVDPAASIPRDPATLNIDVTAMMKWLIDPLFAKNAGTLPVEVDSVSINDLTLTVAGASFNGTGGATLDNSKMPPEPVGEINLNLVGGLGLLDKLVGLGFVPAGQAQMVKSMTGMFTLPGGENGEDNLISKIEMKKGGSIFANGQQIK